MYVAPMPGASCLADQGQEAARGTSAVTGGSLALRQAMLPTTLGISVGLVRAAKEGFGFVSVELPGRSRQSPEGRRQARCRMLHMFFERLEGRETGKELRWKWPSDMQGLGSGMESTHHRTVTWGSYV